MYSGNSFLDSARVQVIPVYLETEGFVFLLHFTTASRESGDNVMPDLFRGKCRIELNVKENNPGRKCWRIYKPRANGKNEKVNTGRRPWWEGIELSGAGESGSKMELGFNLNESSVPVNHSWRVLLLWFPLKVGCANKSKAEKGNWRKKDFLVWRLIPLSQSGRKTTTIRN